ncbi:MAG: T9SS type A sorting domain-containing protein [Gemmatimonadetes bacterium]|nr:T9SS type A sorting domain-containing protein [Gemmatimonadota bacterium]
MSLLVRARFVIPALLMAAVPFPAVGPASAERVTRTDVFPPDRSVCALPPASPDAGETAFVRAVPAPVAAEPDSPDLVTRQWLGVVAAPLSDEYAFTVEDGMVGVSLHAFADEPDCRVSVELLGPGGEVLACDGCPDAPAVGEALVGHGTAQMPSTDRPGWELAPGEYAFRVRAIPDDEAVPCEQLTANVYGQFRANESVRVEHVLDLNFVYLPGSTLSADIAQSSPRFADFLGMAQKWLDATGIRIGRVTHVDLDRPEFDVITTWEEAGRMFRTSSEVGAPRALNVYCVQTFEPPLYPVAGLSGGIPGPALSGTVASGIAMRMAPFFTCSDCLRAYASLFAHEVGHYLGFFHTTEADVEHWDPFSDTPECHVSNLGACPDFDHVMFPLIHTRNSIWSDSQIRIAPTHPLVRTRAVSGPDPGDHEPTGPAPFLAGPNPWSAEGALRLTRAAGPGDWSVDVHDVTGRRLRTLSGTGALTWDGRTTSGDRAPAGVYFLRARAGEDVRTLRVVKTE